MGKPTRSNPAENQATSTEIAPQIEIAIEQALEGKVSKRDLPNVTKKITQIAISEQFSGPMPHPKHLREYESVLPGSAERILKMAEKNVDHFIKMDQDALAAEVDDRKLGMKMGGILFFLLIAAAFVSALTLKDAVITGLFLTTAAIGGVGLFVKGRNGK